MFVYLIIVLLCYLMSIVKTKEVKWTFFVFLTLFLCCGYMTGTDWRNYEKAYEFADFSKVLQERFEVGYGYLQAIVHSCGINFWIFHIVLKIFVFWILCWRVRQLTVNIFLFLAIYLPEMGYYLFIDCPFRNLIALGIFLIALKYLINRSFIKYILLSCLAISFHFSAIILIPLYWISKIHFNKSLLVILFLLVNIFAYELGFIFEHVLLPLMNISSKVEGILSVYLFNEKFLASSFNWGTVHKMFIFVLLLCCQRRLETSCKYGHFIFNMAMVYILLYPFAISIKIFSRFLIFEQPFFIISIILLIGLIKDTIIKFFFIAFIILYSMLKTYQVVTDDSRYVPYTNYVLYFISGELPDFDSRSSYNNVHSPYEKN